MAKTTLYLGRKARKMKPTKKHRPAVWECILGTVHARDDSGQVRYFDYDYDAAFAFACATEDRDPRVWKYNGPRNWGFDLDNPRQNQLVFWITETAKETKT